MNRSEMLLSVIVGSSAFLTGMGMGYRMGWDSGFDTGTAAVDDLRRAAGHAEVEAAQARAGHLACEAALTATADDLNVLVAARSRYRAVVREWRDEACRRLPAAPAPPVPAHIEAL